MPATQVDHIQRINDGGDRFDENNLQGLCDHCHKVKTGREAHLKNCAKPQTRCEQGRLASSPKTTEDTAGKKFSKGRDNADSRKDGTFN